MRFKSIFSGLEIAHGTYKIEGSKDNGKQSGKAVVVRTPLQLSYGKNTLKG